MRPNQMQNPKGNQAYAVIRELSEEEAARLREESYLKFQRDMWSRLEGARREDFVQGQEESFSEWLTNVIRNIARKDLSPAEIADLIDMSPVQIETILRDS